MDDPTPLVTVTGRYEISAIICFYTLLERVIDSQVLVYFNENNLISLLQSAYRGV